MKRKIVDNDFATATQRITSLCIPCKNGGHQYKIQCYECENYPYVLAARYLTQVRVDGFYDTDKE